MKVKSGLIKCSYCEIPAIYENKIGLKYPTINDIKHHPDCKFKR